MTDQEAIKQWQQHWPFERASQELIKRIQRINNAPSTKSDKAEQEVGEALV